MYVKRIIQSSVRKTSCKGTRVKTQKQLMELCFRQKVMLANIYMVAEDNGEKQTQVKYFGIILNRTH